jgi:hypothetical protein
VPAPLRYLTTPSRRQRKEEIVAPPLVWIAVGAALTITPVCAFVGWVAAVLSGTPCGVWP